ncbi:MAG: hypothetical protein LBR93_04265 [Treponema sp.]|jgi:hypothetical protein|nr:hypothetical protein [Treponema sp.]
MFPFLDLAEKVRKKAAQLPAFAGKLADSARGPVAKAGKLVKGWRERTWDLILRGIREKLPWLEGKLGFVLIGLGLVLFLLLVVLVTALVAPNAGLAAAGEREIPAGETGGLIRDAPIPPEELFLPDEPDFLPGVIPQREARKVWTAEDAEPYWYNPLERGGEEWRNRIRAALDEFLEHVP